MVAKNLYCFKDLHPILREFCWNSGSYDGDTSMDQKSHIRKTGKVTSRASILHFIFILRLLDAQF